MILKDKIDTSSTQVGANFARWVSIMKPPEYTIHGVFNDRLLIRPVNTQEWLDWLEYPNFSPWNKQIDKHQPFGKITAIQGWHENKPFISAQLIQHYYYYLEYFEIDWDIGNPDYGLFPLVVHSLEVLWNKVSKRTTNQEWVAASLEKRFTRMEAV